MAASSVSGMASSIRASTESETFDFAGSTASTIQNTITQAFTEPFPPLEKMIRLTFVTGAGKLARQKYDENAARIVTTALRELGYEEDRAASAVMECAGTFKLQHDTGKNLKTVIVFPKIGTSKGRPSTNGTTTASSTVTSHNADSSHMESKESTIESALSALKLEDHDTDSSSSPSSLILLSSPSIFEPLIANKCPTWSQKKACLQLITNVQEKIRSIEAKLLSGVVPLDGPEQDLYNTLSIDVLEQKENYLKAELSKHVDEGRITKGEKEKLISQIRERIETLSKDIDATLSEGKSNKKKEELLRSQKEKATSRLLLLQNITPIPIYPLKYEVEIDQLRKELKPLLKLEEETKGRLLTIKEVTTLARKAEILQEIEKLEENSRDWFEEESDFRARVEASRASSLSRDAKAKTISSKKPTVGNSSNSSKPALVTPKPGSSWAIAGGAATNKKATSNVGDKKSGKNAANTFAAMMMDSDSD